MDKSEARTLIAAVKELTRAINQSTSVRVEIERHRRETTTIIEGEDI